MLLNNSQKENTASAMSSCLIQRSQQLLHDADKNSFIELCHTGLKLEVKVAKFFRLGKAAPNKIRPLPVNNYYNGR